MKKSTKQMLAAGTLIGAVILAVVLVRRPPLIGIPTKQPIWTMWEGGYKAAWDDFTKSEGWGWGTTHNPYPNPADGVYWSDGYRAGWLDADNNLSYGYTDNPHQPVEPS